MAKDRSAPVAPRREVSPGKQKFVALWSKAWGLVGAVIVVFVAARLPETLRADDFSALLRDIGLVVISFNLIMQAARPAWPMFYALPLTVGGISLWLAGWLA